jgi:hypothetical protein
MFSYRLQMQQYTDNDRCARLAKINASNFPSRLKELTKTASIHLPPTQKSISHLKVVFSTRNDSTSISKNDIFWVSSPNI